MNLIGASQGPRLALTQQGTTKHAAREFVAFVQSAAGTKIFAKGGWMAQ